MYSTPNPLYELIGIHHLEDVPYIYSLSTRSTLLSYFELYSSSKLLVLPTDLIMQTLSILYYILRCIKVPR